MTQNVLLIIPAYNEERRILRPLRDYLNQARTLPDMRVRVLVVLNGCRDKTLEVVNSVAIDYPELQSIQYAEPIGKGGALIAGFHHGEGFDWVGFVDADGATAPKALFALLSDVDEDDGDVRIGFRSPSARSILRRTPSIFFNLWVRLLLPIKTRDTQCGAKFFRGWVIKEILPRLSTCDMAVDVDMLFWSQVSRAKVVSRHVEWHEQPGSSVNIARTSCLMFLSVLRLFLLRHGNKVTARCTLWVSERFYRLINRRPRVMPLHGKRHEDVTFSTKKMRKFTRNAVRFVAAGLVVTLIDFVIFKAAIYIGLDLAIARVAGFSLAAGFSFVIHRWWTFEANGSWPRALGLYVQARIVSFVLAQIVFFAVIRYSNLGPDAAFWIQAPVQPAANFLFAHFYVFKSREERSTRVS